MRVRALGSRTGSRMAEDALHRAGDAKQLGRQCSDYQGDNVVELLTKTGVLECLRMQPSCLYLVQQNRFCRNRKRQQGLHLGAGSSAISGPYGAACVVCHARCPSRAAGSGHVLSSARALGRPLDRQLHSGKSTFACLVYVNRPGASAHQTQPWRFTCPRRLLQMQASDTQTSRRAQRCWTPVSFPGELR